MFLGGGCGAPNQNSSDEVKYKKNATTTQCRGCGTINILRIFYIFSSTNPTTLILSEILRRIPI